MIRYFTQHPTAANLLMAGLIVIGLIKAPSLVMETFPQIPFKEVSVSIAFPGAASGDVEQAVCHRIEDALEGVENIGELRCVSQENVAQATVRMSEGADIDQLLRDVVQEIDAISDFPAGVEDPVIEKAGRQSRAASVVITGIEDKVQLKNYAESVKDRMLGFGGIPQVTVAGFSDRQIRIEVRDAAARQLGLTLPEIANALERQNINVPAGQITTETGSILLRFADERRAIHAYSSIVVASSSLGGKIRLGDIATITDTFEAEEVETRLNGRLAAVLDVSKSRKDDLIKVVNRVQAFAAEERLRAAPGVELTVTNDGSVALKDRLRMLTANSIQGLVLVVLAMWVFFGGRQAFWIGMGLPVSFLGALAFMALLGITINMLTMVALLIVVGIMMDDAIVISENIATKRLQGLSAKEAAIEGARQVAPGVVSSFLTTAAIFGSLSFLSGDLGDLLSVIPVVMLLVLAISLIEAFLILPNHLSHGASSEQPGRIGQYADNLLRQLFDKAVGPSALWSVRNRYLSVGLCVMLFLGTLALFAGGTIKFQAFPNVEGNQLEARIELPASANLTATRHVTAEVIGALRRMDAALAPKESDTQTLLRNVLVRYNENSDAGTNGAHLATVSVDLVEGALRKATNEGILTAWRREMPNTLDVRRIVIAEAAVGPAGRAIELRLSHTDINVLDMASEELQSWLQSYDGVYNISDDLAFGKHELSLSLRDSAGALGLDAQAIADQLAGAYNGIVADEVQIGSERLEIDLRLALADRDSFGDLEAFTIKTPSGVRVPIGNVVTIGAERGFARVERIDRRPSVTVTGDVLLGVANANEIVKDTELRFIPRLLASHPGLRADTAGQNSRSAETFGSMGKTIGIGFVMVFILLSFQFRSYAEPVVVMSLIPFALTGAVLGHLLLGIEFSLPSMLGVIALSGIVVNDSILLVQFIKNEHSPDLDSVADIAPLGVKARFRAIFLTSLTTTAGMLPLLFETSPQAQVLVPLVTSVVFGLMATTILIVFIVPAFYTILDDFGLTSLAAERKQKARLEAQQ
ncbi:Toluene efflux pump membrane transporter TtgE [Labrenzia sp. THAF82]|uniref:efflux RND transporter permease subunit n=1 Tax=Labrenzia sp. THAF82 TaxID=2587861 RepID=UPI001268C2C8|nr:efflux RND transporter permease subunit [Labrenzia sp. THAF82]QFT33972.1 Toluene efflux pump membrane transporter TtgE [Labrenzia sp. THAF82]